MTREELLEYKKLSKQRYAEGAEYWESKLPGLFNKSSIISEFKNRLKDDQYSATAYFENVKAAYRSNRFGFENANEHYYGERNIDYYKDRPWEFWEEDFLELYKVETVAEVFMKFIEDVESDIKRIGLSGAELSNPQLALMINILENANVIASISGPRDIEYWCQRYNKPKSKNDVYNLFRILKRIPSDRIQDYQAIRSHIAMYNKDALRILENEISEVNKNNLNI